MKARRSLGQPTQPGNKVSRKNKARTEKEKKEGSCGVEVDDGATRVSAAYT